MINSNIWPTARQELLLRAALLKKEEALQAWYEFKRQADIGGLDGASIHILPLVYSNLTLHNISDSLLIRLKGIYLKVWYQNQMILHAMAALLPILCNERIKVMLLKGAALSLFYYQDYGLRYMADFDFLIHLEDRARTLMILKERGWRQEFPDNKITWECGNSCNFSGPDNIQFDLHWHIFKECIYPGADDDYWNKATPKEFNSVYVLILNPTDQLMHCCIHGLALLEHQPLRWICDAFTIIKVSQAEIDWERLIRQAQRCFFTLQIRKAFAYLKDKFNVSIPDCVLEKLESRPISLIEHIEYKVKIESPTKLFFPGSLFSSLFNNTIIYTRYVRGIDFLTGTKEFLSFAMVKWKVRYLWQLPFKLIYYAVKRTLVHCHLAT